MVPRDYTVRLDLVRFQQVIINLLTNALKYSDGRGTILVTNSVTRLSETSPEVQITVSVKDNGIGISQSDQQQLFTPYFRVKNGPNMRL